MKKFEQPEMIISRFDLESVITASGEVITNTVEDHVQGILEKNKIEAGAIFAIKL